jgi:DNA-binding transcriptional regulator YiaG
MFDRAPQHVLSSLVMSGQEIREFRQRWGLTQEDLAAELGVTSVSVSRWESAGVQPHPSFIEKLVALGKRPSALMRKKNLTRGQAVP